MKHTDKITKFVIKSFLAWQVSIIVVTGISGRFLTLRESYLGGGTQAYVSNPLLYSRGNFDGIHYVSIAKNGYGYAQQAFFPLYPKLISVISAYVPDSYLVGVLISTLSFFLGSIVLIRLLNLDYSLDKSKLVFGLILLFPVSYYFGSVYTEGLFFLLVVCSFYAARHDNWLMAGLLGGVASFTRLAGVFLVPALLVVLYICQKHQFRSSLKKLLCLLLVPLGLLLFVNYLDKTTGDPFAFFHAQKLFGQDRSEKIVLIYQVIWRYVKMVFTVNKSDPLYFTIILEFLIGVVFLISSVVGLFKYRISYSLFSFLTFITPTLTGSFNSIPRYCLVLFPSFLLFADFLSVRPGMRKTVYLLSIALGVVSIALFSRGYWIS